MIKKRISSLHGEVPQYAEDHHRKTFKARSQGDLIKGIVEIIKNGVDAYLEEKKVLDDKKSIDIFWDAKRKFIRIINYAEGMSPEKFKKALKVGGTSEDKEIEEKTGAHHFGMKEAAWAFEYTRIVSVKDGFCSSRIFYWDEKNIPRY